MDLGVAGSTPVIHPCFEYVTLYIEGMDAMTNNELKANVAANLRRLMDARSLSQADLARQIGHPPVYVFRMLHGLHRPNLTILSIIAEALGTTVDEMLRSRSRAKVS